MYENKIIQNFAQNLKIQIICRKKTNLFFDVSIGVRSFFSNSESCDNVP